MFLDDIDLGVSKVEISETYVVIKGVKISINYVCIFSKKMLRN